MFTFILSKFWKTVIFIVGLVITLAGLIMLFTPGPGIAAIFIGLGILATEFIWAKHLIHKLSDYLKKKGKDIKSYTIKNHID
tara:strand:- start:1444 stop:1689 length:246 start_codon:yes stop_codon:yes gene_type:complete